MRVCEREGVRVRGRVCVRVRQREGGREGGRERGADRDRERKRVRERGRVYLRRIESNMAIMYDPHAKALEDHLVLTKNKHVPVNSQPQGPNNYPQMIYLRTYL